MDRACDMLAERGLADARARPAGGGRDPVSRPSPASCYLVVTATRARRPARRPLGTDFSNFYAAGTYVLDGNAEAPFDLARQHAREQEIFGAATPFYGWHYPPFFLFVAAALALMPYGAGARGLAGGDARALSAGDPGDPVASRARHAPPADAASAARAADAIRLWLLLALAFPAVLVNIGHGQNGFLTAALLGGALVMLDRRPLLAGILFGLLAYKPQFGLMIPLVLGGERPLAHVSPPPAATVALLAVATTIAFGAACVAGVFRLDPISPASSCSNRAIPAGTKFKASSPGRGCGARRSRSPTRLQGA